MNIAPRDWTDRQIAAYMAGQPLRAVLDLEDHTRGLIGTIDTTAAPAVTPAGDAATRDGSARPTRS